MEAGPKDSLAETVYELQHLRERGENLKFGASALFFPTFLSEFVHKKVVSYRGTLLGDLATVI